MVVVVIVVAVVVALVLALVLVLVLHDLREVANWPFGREPDSECKGWSRADHWNSCITHLHI